MSLSPISQLVVLGLALALDLLLGDPPNRWHPVAWMGRFIGWAKEKAPARPPSRFAYGTALVSVGVAICTLPVLFLLSGAGQFGALVYAPVAALLLESTFAWSGLHRAAGAVQRELQSGNLPEARRLVSWHLVSRDTSALDTQQVTAAAVESMAENLTDSVVAPLLFFLLAGVPGAWAYRFFNTCDSMIGYRDPKHEYLGKFAARLDDLLNWLPARMTALLMIPAAALAGEDAAGAWRTMWKQHGRTASPNAGWSMSAMAGALHVTLGKAGQYCLEGGTAELTAATTGRATRLAGLTATIFALVLAPALVWLEETVRAV